MNQVQKDLEDRKASTNQFGVVDLASGPQEREGVRVVVHGSYRNHTWRGHDACWVDHQMGDPQSDGVDNDIDDLAAVSIDCIDAHVLVDPHGAPYRRTRRFGGWSASGSVGRASSNWGGEGRRASLRLR